MKRQETWGDFFGRVAKEVFDPFELLYIAIAIATFSHTQWMAAFWFEGKVPTDPVELNLWYFRGSLIAIAIDVGMFMTSRFLQNTRTNENRAILIIAFIIAALGSFFTQLGYMLYHTPEFQMSTGVSSYWQATLDSIIQARVILVPLMLPLLASVYTVARIFRLRDLHIIEEERAAAEELRIEKEIAARSRNAEIKIESVEQLLQLVEEKRPQLLAGAVTSSSKTPTTDEEVIGEEDEEITVESLGLPSEWINLAERKYWDDQNKVWRGPYKSVKTMLQMMRATQTRRSRKAARLNGHATTTEVVEPDEE